MQNDKSNGFPSQSVRCLLYVSEMIKSATFVLIVCPTGNGTGPVFPNNSAAPVPRDPSFGAQGRPNGRVTGNGPPPVTAGGTTVPPKPTVTISNGRDPRRASKR